MDGETNERWCMLRCASGSQNNAVIDQIMLRFRPIAPKPVSNDAVSGNSSVNNRNLLLTGKRTKRKYVRVRKNNNGYKRKNNNNNNNNSNSNNNQKNDNKTPSNEGKNDEDVVTTLQLLPEKTDLEISKRLDQSWCSHDLDHYHDENDDIHQNLTTPTRLKDIKRQVMMIDGHALGGFDLPDQTVVVESWVTVESVTYTCMDAGGLGLTDVERMNNLDSDTCPGFVSDGSNRVQWVNGAYKRMVMTSQEKLEGQSPPPEFVVWLVIKEKLPSLHGAFTARVRLQYTWQKEKYSEMVPCDVYRMDNGGFAWRLDVEAALSLGRRR